MNSVAQFQWPTPCQEKGECPLFAPFSPPTTWMSPNRPIRPDWVLRPTGRWGAVVSYGAAAIGVTASLQHLGRVATSSSR